MGAWRVLAGRVARPVVGVMMVMAGVLVGTSRGVAQECVGDCNRDGGVTVDEIVRMVNIALGSQSVGECTVGDGNKDGEVTVDEIIAAVNHGLGGCPASAGTPTPLLTPTLARSATPSPTATPDLGQGGDWIRWREGGVARSADPRLIFPGAAANGAVGFLFFQGSTVAGPNGYGLAITLGGIAGPGTYPLGVNFGTRGGGTALYYGPSQSWATPFSGAAGSITITTLSETRVVGSFEFTAEPLTGSGPSVRITEGSFSVPRTPGYVAPGEEVSGHRVTAILGDISWEAATIVGTGGGTSLRVLVASNQNYTVTITLSGITQPGSGPLTGAALPGRRVQVAEFPSGRRWGGLGSDLGSLEVTQLSDGRVVGTFAGVLEANPGTVGSLTVVGNFDVRTP